MKPEHLAFSALVFFAIQNVLLEQKLSGYNTFALLIFFYLVMLPLAVIGWIYLKLTNQVFIPIPLGEVRVFLIILAAVLYFLGDSCYIGAYTSGGSIFTITTIVVMFPVMTSIIRHFWVGGLPNIYHVIGYISAVVAVLFITKGNNH